MAFSVNKFITQVISTVRALATISVLNSYLSNLSSEGIGTNMIWVPVTIPDLLRPFICDISPRQVTFSTQRD